MKAGFRGFDTANRRKHYDEDAVGIAIAAAIARVAVQRNRLLLQTKFTREIANIEWLADPRGSRLGAR